MGQLQSAIDQLALEPIEQFTVVELADSLVELEASVSRLEAERCRRLALFADRKAHRELEYSSPSAFLVDRAKIAPGRATRLVAQAEALAQMQYTASAWTAGSLSADQARHLFTCQTVDAETFAAHEEMLVDTVSDLSIVDTGRAVAYWREANNPSGAAAEQEKLYGMRRLHLSQTFEGMFRLDGYLDPVTGEIVKAALDAATPPPAQGDPRTPAQRRADALADLCRQALDTGDLPEQGGERPHLLVLVGAERLHPSIHRTGVAETVSGTVFTQTTIDCLACDCAVTRIVFGPNSEIVDVGRKTRVIPPALRRAVIARDRRCQHPGCPRPSKWCDIDHIIAWQDGGTTSLDNLQLLCRYHHRLKHFRTPLRQ